MDSDSPLQVIVGEKLSSITFVMDYVQLSFGGPCLTAYVGPAVSFGDNVIAWGKPGFRDALCERIGTIVRQVEVVYDEEIRISFSDGAVISVSLKSEDAVGPEAAQFVDSTGDAQIWVVF